MRLPLPFYRRPTKIVAQELLGKILVHQLPNGHRLAGKIVETEAYLGIKDKACHTYAGRRTARTESMYLPGGHAYIYLTYGMYNCFNVVTETHQHPEAVLIRALEPVEGVEQMQKLRKVTGLNQICSGPGKLCQAMNIDRRMDGVRLTKAPLYIETSPVHEKFKIIKQPRIGVDYAEECAAWPLRFFIAESKFLSKQ